MAKAPIEAPRAWVDEPSDTGDGAIGRLLRGVPEPEPLSAAALAQVHARLGKSRSASRTSRRAREVVLAFVMLLAGASVALAGWGVSDWVAARRRGAAESLPGMTAVSPSAPAVSPSVVAAVPVAAPAANVIEAASMVKAASPPIVAAIPSAGVAPTSTSAAANASALAAESAALEAALLKLRREHDAAGALALLDQSDALFARGSLGLEAKIARVDSLLALGRKREALLLLERLPFAQVGRGSELRLLRAELRARSDCGSALADFDLLTRVALPPLLAERAVYGRAACELQVGDDAHARSDFGAYLQRYPEGRFATNVRQQLARLGEKAPEQR